MVDTADVKRLYREFEIVISAKQMQDLSWTAGVEVWFQDKQIGMQGPKANYTSKQAAEHAAYLYGCEVAESWRIKKGMEQMSDGTVILVGNMFYRFPTAADARAALQWLADNNASAGDFDIKFASFRYMAISLGAGFTI